MKTLMTLPYSDQPFDPANLPLTGWWRTNYIGSSLGIDPWYGSKSMGPSMSDDRVLIGNQLPPTTEPAIGTSANGHAINGLSTALCDGINNRIGIQYLGALFYLNPYRFWGGFFIKPLTAQPAGVNGYDDPPIIDCNSHLGIGYSDVGVRAYCYDGTFHTSQPVPCPTNTWSWVEWWLLSRELHISVNGVENAPITNLFKIKNLVSSGIQFACSWDQSKFFHGAYGDIMLQNDVLPDRPRTAIRTSYLSSRYGVAL